ncbi:hypothetical protein C8024_00220 [Sphingopyxis sp. BSNA05]|uniref:hypothetical protein n=1 Tax=Sphingomonadales TaxID=204457 RepID=UPI000C1F6A5D|nr:MULTISPECIES: hypothetical protein [Sphingomonadaceae]ATW02416.1 hypothetical protein CHN51_01910 [Sphingorhabdus sp. YGSMI21]NRD88213.1 hypothetical protein [Sphingopyxis sp. BSNA05]
MIKFQRRALSKREKELFLGNLVTWGSLLSAVALAIALVPVSAAEGDHNAMTSSVEAVPLDLYSKQG